MLPDSSKFDSMEEQRNREKGRYGTVKLRFNGGKMEEDVILGLVNELYLKRGP